MHMRIQIGINSLSLTDIKAIINLNFLNPLSEEQLQALMQTEKHIGFHSGKRKRGRRWSSKKRDHSLATSDIANHTSTKVTSTVAPATVPTATVPGNTGIHNSVQTSEAARTSDATTSHPGLILFNEEVSYISLWMTLLLMLLLLLLLLCLRVELLGSEMLALLH